MGWRMDATMEFETVDTASSQQQQFLHQQQQQQEQQYYQQQQQEYDIHSRPMPVPEPESKRRRMETTSQQTTMDVDGAERQQQHDWNQLPKPTSKPPSPYDDDEFVYQILRNSGLRNHSDIVNYCVATGIPVSRMLQLDLMRRLSSESG